MGYKPPTICHMLREEGLIANRMGIHKFLQKHRETKNIERRPSSGRPTKMTAAVKALLERQMRGDDETTTVQLHALLLPNHPWSFIQHWIVLDRFIQWRIVLRSFYSAMNRSRTVHSFRLNKVGGSYNEKGQSVFVSFCNNNIILSHTVCVQSFSIIRCTRISYSCFRTSRPVCTLHILNILDIWT